jgi:hypothetical protein
MPLYSVAASTGRKRVQIGFEVVLAGAFGSHEETPLPGSAAVDDLFRDLRRIAAAVLPEDDGEIDHDIELFDHGLAEPARRHRVEVQLKIAITNHEGFQRSVDIHEVECIRTMEARLRKLGAHKGKWGGPQED